MHAPESEPEAGRGPGLVHLTEVGHAPDPAGPHRGAARHAGDGHGRDTPATLGIAWASELGLHFR